MIVNWVARWGSQTEASVPSAGVLVAVAVLGCQAVFC